MSETFSSFIAKDERDDPASDEREEMIIYLPYYKQGVSDAEAANIAERMMDRILRSFVRYSFKLSPQFALTVRAGDRIKIKTATPPIIDAVVEVYDSNVDIGDPGVFKGVKLPDSFSTPTTFCSGKFCQDKFC